MILNLIGTLERCPPPVVDVDPHIPLTVTWQDRDNTSEQPFTLVLGDAVVGAVAELKFEGATGALYELILIDEGSGERMNRPGFGLGSINVSMDISERFWVFVREVSIPETMAAAIDFQDGETLQILWGAAVEWLPGPEGAQVDFAVDAERRTAGLRLKPLHSGDRKISS